MVKYWSIAVFSRDPVLVFSVLRTFRQTVWVLNFISFLPHFLDIRDQLMLREFQQILQLLKDEQLILWSLTVNGSVVIDKSLVTHEYAVCCGALAAGFGIYTAQTKVSFSLTTDSLFIRRICLDTLCLTG